MVTLQSTAILLVVDVQQGLDETAYYGGNRNNPDAETNIESLIHAWREANRTVLFVKHNSVNPKSPLRPNQPGNAFKPQAQPLPGEVVIEKSVNSAFIGTDLDERLQRMGAQQLVIVGLTTNHCVSTTARMSGNLGYETYLVGDATAAFDRRGLDGTLYPAQLIHDTTLASLHGEFATVVQTADVLAAVQAH